MLRVSWKGGSTETGHLMMENEHGEMVPSLDTAYLEVLEPGLISVATLAGQAATNKTKCLF